MRRFIENIALVYGAAFVLASFIVGNVSWLNDVMQWERADRTFLVFGAICLAFAGIVLTSLTKPDVR